MMNIVKRPNFFPGQVVDYRDFNRLSQQSDRMMGLICRSLFQGGGIVKESLSEFRVEILDGLSLKVNPGMAVLPSGIPLVLDKSVLVDLQPYREQNAKVLMVCLQAETIGSDHYQDELDPSIQGFLSESVVSRIVVSEGDLAPDSVELFRVSLSQKVDRFVFMDPREGWAEGLNQGVLDFRYRKLIVSQTYFPIDTKKFVALRTALYAIESSYQKLKKIYYIRDEHSCMLLLSQLHAELLNRPFQPSKLSFLSSEFSHRLSCFLADAQLQLGERRSNFKRELFDQIIAHLQPLKSKSVLPDLPLLDKFVDVSQGLLQAVAFAESKYSFVNTINEYLLDIVDRDFPLVSRVNFCGQPFVRVDGVDSRESTRLSIKSHIIDRRVISSTYRDGSRMEHEGVFIEPGTVVVRFRVSDPKRPLVLMMNQYIRRGGTRIQYEVNGKVVEAEQHEIQSEIENKWRNKGILVDPEFLSAGENVMRMKVTECELDFGFFNMIAYQPFEEASSYE